MIISEAVDLIFTKVQKEEERDALLSLIDIGSRGINDEL